MSMDEQKQATTLVESEARFRTLIEGMAQAVWETDAEGKAVADSPSWRAYTGQTLQQWLGHGWLDAVHPEDRAFAEQQWRESVMQRRPVNAEFRLRHVGSGWRWTNVRAAPLLNPDGSVRKWVGMNIDISERKQAEAALRDSEAKFRAVAENARAIFGIIQGGRFIYANRYLAEISGYSLDEILSMDFSRLIHPDFRKQVMDCARRRLSGEAVPTHYEFAMVTRTGETRWLDFSVDRMELNGRAALIGTAFDVTERRRAEESSRNWENRLRLALESGRMGTWDWDMPTRQLEWSEGHYTLLGYRVGEVEPTIENFFRRVHPDDLPRMEEKLRQTMEQRDQYTIEFRVLLPDGSVRWLEARGKYVYDDRGQAVRMYGVLTDIDDKKRAEQFLHQAKDLAETANRAKDQFLAVLSHELRTPLTPILTTAEMMEQDPALSDEQRDSISMIRRNVELESRLIDDLLDLTRIARGKLELHFAPVDLHERLHHVVEMCRSEIAAKELKLTVQTNAAHPHVLADATRLQQILWNLLRNAAKFTPPCGSISVRTENTDDGWIAVTIQDTGIGIAPEILPRLFSNFEQGSRDVTREFGGLGLGLAISKGLVDLHGGQLTAYSEGKGRGATFTLRLRTSTRAESPHPPPDRHDHPAADASEFRILLVEDHADTRKSMTRLLQSFGYTVAAAENMASALQMLDADDFDLIISDIGLPDGSGLDLVRRLLPQKPMKAIALSGYGQEADIQRSREAGFAAHVTKPISVQVFEETVRNVLAARPNPS